MYNHIDRRQINDIHTSPLFLKSVMYIQCRHLSLALNTWADRTLDCHPLLPGCIIDLTTGRSFDSQATRVIGVLCIFFDVLSMGVSTTRLWQMSGRPVQEWNVRSVYFVTCVCLLGSVVGICRHELFVMS